MVNDNPQTTAQPTPAKVDPLAPTQPWPAPQPSQAEPGRDDKGYVFEEDRDEEMTPIGPGLNDGELLPDDTPPIENDQSHSDLAHVDVTRPQRRP